MKKFYLSLIVAFTSLIILPETAKACIEIPTNLPDVCVETCVGPDNLTYLRIKDYATYGANVGEYCACALNIPQTFGTVISASVVHANTNTTVNGWSFMSDPDTQFPGSTAWQGFSSAVDQVIPSGMAVDLLFCIETSCEQGTGFCCQQAAANIAQYIQNNDAVVGTGAADDMGVPIPDQHLAVFPVGNILIVNPTCDDGVLNANEVGIDCGGPDCPPCSLDNCLDLDKIYLDVDEDAIFHSDVAIRGNLCVMGQLFTPSDLALKEDIQLIENSISKIEQITPVTYSFAHEQYPGLNLPEGKQYGVIAQELEKVYPEFVTDELLIRKTSDKTEAVKAVSYNKLIPILVSAIKELNGELKTKDQEINQLKSSLQEIEAMKKSIETLQQQLESYNFKND